LLWCIVEVFQGSMPVCAAARLAEYVISVTLLLQVLRAGNTYAESVNAAVVHHEAMIASRDF
jgi:hypothetical protein